MCMDHQRKERRKIFGEIEELEDEVERRFNRLKNFDIISHPPSDHHYLNHKYLNMKKTASKSGFIQRIKQEWSLLEKGLPDSIFLRAYEERIDLMRAAIVGQPDSPYHHCLFFFDIYFPASYPSAPPKFHYHSYGLDLHPNLHPDGTVCLTLLQTLSQRLAHNWHGSNDKERWNAKESSLLFVFHAIQNVMLSSNLHTKSKYDINNKTFMLTCKNMVRILREPPMDFEDFVAGHFRKRAHPVLLKFKKECRCDDEAAVDLFVSLLKAFESSGAYCKHHLDFLKSRKQQISKAEVESIWGKLPS